MPMPEPATPAAPRADLGALWRHRALVLGAGYAFVALVGALYYALLLGDFGQNPFDYWEASDFLLAAFREPLALAFGLVAVTMYIAFVDPLAINDRLYRRGSRFAELIRYERWRESRWMAPRVGPLAGSLLALLWFVLVMGGFAAGAARDARTGRGVAVHATIDGGEPFPAQLLATTNRFAFLVRPGSTEGEARLLAVPFESLTLLGHCGARRGGLRALVRGVEPCTVTPAATAPPSAAGGG
jgi:hypothetical protein